MKMVKDGFKRFVKLCIGLPVAFLWACCILLIAAAIIILGAVFVGVLAVIFAAAVQLSPLLVFFGLSAVTDAVKDKAKEFKEELKEEVSKLDTDNVRPFRSNDK